MFQCETKMIKYEKQSVWLWQVYCILKNSNDSKLNGFRGNLSPVFPVALFIPSGNVLQKTFFLTIHSSLRIKKLQLRIGCGLMSSFVWWKGERKFIIYVRIYRISEIIHQLKLMNYSLIKLYTWSVYFIKKVHKILIYYLYTAIEWTYLPYVLKTCEPNFKWLAPVKLSK